MCTQLYTVHCRVYSVQYTRIHCKFTLYIVIIQCTMFTVHCTNYNIPCTLYDLHCTLYSVRRTMYSVHSSKFWTPVIYKWAISHTFSWLLFMWAELMVGICGRSQTTRCKSGSSIVPDDSKFLRYWGRESERANGGEMGVESAIHRCRLCSRETERLLDREIAISICLDIFIREIEFKIIVSAVYIVISMNVFDTHIPSVQYTLNIQYTVYSIQCTLYMVIVRVHYIQCTLYPVYYQSLVYRNKMWCFINIRCLV